MDELEKYVRQNREDFDDSEPSKDLWKEILEETFPKNEVKVVPIKRLWQVSFAASILLIIGIGISWNLLTPETAVVATIDETPAVKNDFTLSDVSPEMAEVEGYYIHQVNDKMSLLQNMDVDPALYEEILMLDEEFNLLKKEFGEALNSEDIVEAMIENYRIKLEILEAILESVETNNQDKIEEDEVEDTVYM